MTVPSDHTLELLKDIPDPRLRVIAQPNCGPGAARNAGIEAAAGDLIGKMLAGYEEIHFVKKTENLL